MARPHRAAGAGQCDWEARAAGAGQGGWGGTRRLGRQGGWGGTWRREGTRRLGRDPTAGGEEGWGGTWRLGYRAAGAGPGGGGKGEWGSRGFVRFGMMCVAPLDPGRWTANCRREVRWDHVGRNENPGPGCGRNVGSWVRTRKTRKMAWRRRK